MRDYIELLAGGYLLFILYFWRSRSHMNDPGRPAVIATREDLRFTDSYALIPAHTLLWALG